MSDEIVRMTAGSRVSPRRLNPQAIKRGIAFPAEYRLPDVSLQSANVPENPGVATTDRCLRVDAMRRGRENTWVKELHDQAEVSRQANDPCRRPAVSERKCDGWH